jgi:hypothetical protein
MNTSAEECSHGLSEDQLEFLTDKYDEVVNESMEPIYNAIHQRYYDDIDAAYFAEIPTAIKSKTVEIFPPPPEAAEPEPDANITAIQAHSF